MNREELENERRAVVENITKAFHGVTREGGVSWLEAAVIDDYGTEEEQAAARARDIENGWPALLADPAWNYGHGSNFCFLDPIGFRYYLAPAMILTVQEASDFSLQFKLMLKGTDSDDDRGNDWSLLDPRQTRAVGRFLRYMIEKTRAHYASGGVKIDDPEGWVEAYEGYWKPRCEGSPPTNADGTATKKKN